jgi:Uma2 family endonuclease
MIAKGRLITEEELAWMRFEEPCELIDGKVVRISPAGMYHGIVGGNVLRLLTRHVLAKNAGLVMIGGTGFRVRRDPDTVRAPDIAFVTRANLERARTSGDIFFPNAPDLAVEVLSPDDTWKSMEEKVRDYLSAQGRLVWVVSPTLEMVYVYAPGENVRGFGPRDDIDAGEVLPGFTAPVSAFFDDTVDLGTG